MEKKGCVVVLHLYTGPFRNLLKSGTGTKMPTQYLPTSPLTNDNGVGKLSVWGSYVRCVGVVFLFGGWGGLLHFCVYFFFPFSFLFFFKG